MCVYVCVCIHMCDVHVKLLTFYIYIYIYIYMLLTVKKLLRLNKFESHHLEGFCKRNDVEMYG